MPDGSRLEFNILFIPGTFGSLGFLALGLLHHLGCSLRLVSNGCSREEEAQLEALCAESPRLEYFSLGSPRVVPHGLALNQLQQIETSEHFCFMDSDILATGDFLAPLAALLDDHVAVFSGRPLWQPPEATVQSADNDRVPGRYIWSRDGFLLGATYLAMYCNRSLTEAIEATGVGFEPRAWGEIPPRTRLTLVKYGLKADYYDAGKLVNILLQDRGGRVTFSQPPNLHHIGGLSVCAYLDRQTGGSSPAETKGKRRWARHFHRHLELLADGQAEGEVLEIADSGSDLRLDELRFLESELARQYNAFGNHAQTR